MADYPHVPGFTVNVQDGGLVIPTITANNATETLLILGPAPKGATDTPGFINDQTALGAYATDPKSPYGADAAGRNLLTSAWRQAYDAGCRNVYLMRLKDTTTVTNEAVGTGDATKTAFTLANSGVVTSTLKVKKGGVDVAAADYTYNDSTKTITFKAAPAEAAAITASYEYLPADTAKNLFMSLHDTLDLLSSIDIFDNIAVVGLYANDEVTLTADDATTLGTGYAAGPADIVGEVAKYVVEQIASNNEVLGFIGAKALGKLNPTLAEVRAHVDGLADLADKYNGFVSVVGGIDLAFNCGFDYADTGVAAYAGLTTTLAPHSATTNKPLNGARLVYNPTLTMLEALGDKKYVTFRRRGAAVTPTIDVTAAPDSSDFTLLSTARIILTAAKLTRQVCEPFIGEGASPESVNAMKTALEKTYKAMVDSKAILNFDYSVNMTAQDFLNGRTAISLAIVPSLERRKINLDIIARAQI